MVQDILATRDSNAIKETSIKEARMVGWIRPKEGFLKLNTDGSFREELAQASAGGLLRDGSGKWIAGFTANLGQCDSLMAETWATIHDLKMAWKTRCRKLNLEMDSLLLTRLIMEQSTQQRFVPFLHKIKQLLSREWEVSI